MAAAAKTDREGEQFQKKADLQDAIARLLESTAKSETLDVDEAIAHFRERERKARDASKEAKTKGVESFFLEQAEEFGGAADFLHENRGAATPRGRTREPASAQRSEAERGREYHIERILRGGGVRVHTSIHRSDVDFRVSGHGFQDLSDDRLSEAERDRYPRMFLDIASMQERAQGMSEQEDVLQAHGRCETVTFVRERRPHADAMRGGSNEPVVWLVYRAVAPKRMVSEMGWTDYSGRKGQILYMEIALSESVAKEIQSALMQDPALIRHVAERVMKERIIPRHPERWEHPPATNTRSLDGLRPPYEKWDTAKNGGRIYVQPLDHESGWHDEYDRRIVNG